MYIVTSPALIQAVQKQPKTLAFPPIEAKFACQICGSSPEARDILMKNVNGDEGDWGLSMESYSAIKGALAPGAELDGMNRIMIQNVAASVDRIGNDDQPVRVKLAEWLRTTITMATTNAVYGPSNPYKNEAVQNGFWYVRSETETLYADIGPRDFEKDLMKILIGFLPSIIASKGLAGRDRVTKAFEKYFNDDGHKQGSILMQNRYSTSAKHGVSIPDIARYEVGGSVAILVNTVPAAFWTFFFIYSRPQLLAAIREEILNTVVTTSSEAERTYNTIDVTALKTDCPLLASTFQEILRHRSMGSSVRQVMQDTLLDGRWLLKKDSIIQMPSLVVHENSSIWGPDSSEFDPRRFMKEEKKKRPSPSAFRAFGGGSTLCPGRHFATNEVLALTSMFLLRYDVKPTAGDWIMPTTYNTNTAAVIMEPDTDIEVELIERPHSQGDAWEFSLKASDRIFAMTAEDRPE